LNDSTLVLKVGNGKLGTSMMNGAATCCLHNLCPLVKVAIFVNDIQQVFLGNLVLKCDIKLHQQSILRDAGTIIQIDGLILKTVQERYDEK
jgi:hypothetical protein